jgi:hypothetical protein
MNKEGGWGKSVPASPSAGLQSNVHVYLPDNRRNVNSMSDTELETEIFQFLSLLDKHVIMERLGIPVNQLPESLRSTLSK